MVNATKLVYSTAGGLTIGTLIYVQFNPVRSVLIERNHYGESKTDDRLYTDHSAKNRFDYMSRLKEVTKTNITLPEHTIKLFEEQRRVNLPPELSDLLEAK